jgi:hypothetical protein
MAEMRTRTKWLFACFFVLYGAELLLALLLSAAWVKDAPQLLAFAARVKIFAPVVGYFDRVARYPEGLRVFLAISVCLLPLKACLSYFAINASSAIECEYASDKPLKERTFAMILGIFLAIFLLIEMLNFGSRGHNWRAWSALWHGIATGGFFLWLSWSFIALGVTSLFLAAAAHTVRDWCIY